MVKGMEVELAFVVSVLGDGMGAGAKPLIAIKEKENSIL